MLHALIRFQLSLAKFWHMLKQSLLLFFCINVMSLAAQVSSDSGSTMHDHSHQYKYLNTAYQHIDTTLSVKDFRSFNEFRNDNSFRYNLGNQGSQILDRVFYADSQTFLGLGPVGYFQRFRTKEQVPLYNVLTPLAELHYITGYKRGQNFGGFLSQNIHDRWNYLLSFHRTSSQGRYFAQKNEWDDLVLATHYKSPRRKFEGIYMFIWNRSANQENGGLRDPAEFEENQEGNRELINIKLLDSRGISRKTQLFTDQAWFAQRDTVSGAGWGVYHVLDLSDRYHAFKSTDTLLGPGNLDSLITRDSTHFNQFFNEAGWQWSGAEGSGLRRIRLGAWANYSEYSSQYLSRGGWESGVLTRLHGNTESGWAWILDARLRFAERGAAWNGKAKITVPFGPNARFTARAIYSRSYPDYFYEGYISNHFQWINKFESIDRFMLEGMIRYGQWLNIKAGIEDLKNYIYFNQQAVPEQAGSGANILKASLELRSFPKSKWHLDNRVFFQQVLDGQSFIRLPQWSWNAMAYADFSLFQRALIGEIGFELRYFSSYQANAYMPATGIFYVQDSRGIGDFIYLNFFASFQVKTFSLYFKVENILEGITPYNYYSAVDYPMADRGIRVGLKWRFFN